MKESGGLNSQFWIDSAYGWLCAGLYYKGIKEVRTSLPELGVPHLIVGCAFLTCVLLTVARSPPAGRSDRLWVILLSMVLSVALDMGIDEFGSGRRGDAAMSALLFCIILCCLYFTRPYREGGGRAPVS